MKLLTSKSGKKILKMTKKEWQEYGKEAGFVDTKTVKTSKDKNEKITKEAKIDKLTKNINYIIKNDPKSLEKLSSKCLNDPVVIGEIKKAVKKDKNYLNKLSDETVLKIISE